MFGGFGRVAERPRRVVAVPCLDAELLLVRKRDLQRVVAPVYFQILGRESQQIGQRRRRTCFPHRFIDVIAVVEESAARSIRKLSQNILLGGLCRDAVRDLETSRAQPVVRRVGNVPQYVGRIETARVDRVNHDIRPRGAIHHFRSFGLQCRRDESRRDENEHALTGHGRQVSHYIFQVPVGILCFVVALNQRPVCSDLRQVPRRSGHIRVPAESALECFVCGHGERLRVIPVHDEFGLVITHLRTIMKIAAGQGARHDSEQRFLKRPTIIRELLRQLPGGGVH